MKFNKKILIIITIVTLMGSIYLIHNFTKVVKHTEQTNTEILNETKKLESISGGELLTPQQLGEFATYGSSKVKTSFYKPVPIYAAKDYLKDIFSTINFNIADNLPFKVGKEEAYIVQVRVNSTNEIKSQVHFVYLKDKGPLRSYKDEFVVISVYEMDASRINDMFDVLKKVDKDAFGNKVVLLEKDGLTFVDTKITTNEAFVYNYYQYNDVDKKLISNANAANKIITQKNGLVYDVGYYLSDSTKEKEDKVLYSLINFINPK
ncbi:hypothetical protein LGK97_18770 [Clostridium sp. CS001]|uniref:hypothetical protein n=1 Tax=Clostridium sp. CS001 TaxID=2880648 RepID=UPI001CF37A3C|nr:hypothetical protein [Clostridium sp. CS001]MCB2291758.1 hypothetical protein [Clostridium sp. CS001]